MAYFTYQVLINGIFVWGVISYNPLIPTFDPNFRPGTSKDVILWHPRIDNSPLVCLKLFPWKILAHRNWEWFHATVNTFHFVSEKKNTPCSSFEKVIGSVGFKLIHSKSRNFFQDFWGGWWNWTLASMSPWRYNRSCTVDGFSRPQKSAELHTSLLIKSSETKTLASRYTSCLGSWKCNKRCQTQTVAASKNSQSAQDTLYWLNCWVWWNTRRRSLGISST